MVEIRWTEQSLEDIDNIAQYIANDSLKYAEIQVQDFFDSVIHL
jgi:plasmid stabilization system protein ParE